MSDLLYNDDVELNDSGSLSGSNSDTSIDDNSSHSSGITLPTIGFTDGTSRPTDGWVISNEMTGGTGGEVYIDIAPIEKNPIPEIRYVTITQKTRQVIHDYSSTYLSSLYNDGCKFYVIYTDGTEDEVEYTEIYDPHQPVVSTYVNEAYEIANAIDQHFWDDTNGIHVTDVSQEDWETAVTASFSDLSSNKQYHNILINSLGILLRSALNNLVSLSRSGMTIYDGLGNDITNILASFAGNGATFRESGKTRATVTTQGLTVYDDSGSVADGIETLGAQVAFIGIDASGKPFTRIGKSVKGYIEIGVNANDNGYIDFYNGSTRLGHIGYDAGIDENGNTSNAPYYTFGRRNASFNTVGNYSFIEGVDNIASGYTSHAEGYHNRASGYASHAEGCDTIATNSYAHAEGYGSDATGNASHAEGRSSEASGESSHAEGYLTTASGKYSHAEGRNAKATGDGAHAEGGGTASGSSSHAEGGTASGSSSHSEGYSTASGSYAHSEGFQTEATKIAAHAEGYLTKANGEGSHASGAGTIAGYNYQFVCGTYNSNNSNSLFEVGNGSYSTSANAFRVTKSNTAYVGSTQVTSDKRIKTDLGILDISEATDFIKSLIPHKYEKFGHKELGFFAQDVEQDLNYGDILVEQYEDHGYKDFRSLSYEGLIAPIVSALQGTISKTEELEYKIEQLEKENSDLRHKNQQLEDRLARIEAALGL